jgi:hypothetical protein
MGRLMWGGRLNTRASHPSWSAVGRFRGGGRSGGGALQHPVVFLRSSGSRSVARPRALHSSPRYQSPAVRRAGGWRAPGAGTARVDGSSDGPCWTRPSQTPLGRLAPARAAITVYLGGISCLLGIGLAVRRALGAWVRSSAIGDACAPPIQLRPDAGARQHLHGRRLRQEGASVRAAAQVWQQAPPALTAVPLRAHCCLPVARAIF